MSRRKLPQSAPASNAPESMAGLRTALTQYKKAEWVDLLLELAQVDGRVRRQLTARIDVSATPDELVAATRQAIADATAFEPRNNNRNFDYDDAAYSDIRRNLGRLIMPDTSAWQCSSRSN